MKAEEFQILAGDIEKLTPHQRSVLADRLRELGHIRAVNTLVESRAVAKPVCPCCGHERVSRWGTATGLQRYRCGACKATFNLKTSFGDVQSACESGRLLFSMNCKESPDG